MTTPTAPPDARSGPPWRLAATVLLAAVGLWLLGGHVRLAVEKYYNVDEFQYAHGAWLIAQGEVIYRDFFEHHLPLVHQYMAGVFLLVGDEDPANVLILRLAMLPFLLLAALAAWTLLAPRCGRWGLFGAVAVLMIPTYSAMAVEVRPDPIAGALFLWAIAVHAVGRLSLRARGALSGALLVLALWGTLKTVYFGLIFPLALGIDLWRLRRGEKGDFLLSSPLAFVVGASVAALPIAIYLTITGTWDDIYQWTIAWSFVHQWHYPGFPWVRNFVPLLAQSLWLFPFGIVGLVDAGRTRDRQPGSADALLLGALVTTLLSFAWQSAAYLYSLIPFTLVLAVFAARGAVVAVRALLAGAREVPALRFYAVLLVALLALEAQRAGANLDRMRAADNSAQHAAWAKLAALTRPDEPVYHIAGGQITRPSVHYFYFMEAVIRKLKDDVFAREYPRALVEKGCIAYLWSERFGRLALPLQGFLAENYLPYDQDLWFWGKRLRLSGGAEQEFPAVRDGRYFIWPLAAAEGLEIDGHPLAGPIVELAKGVHRVRAKAGAALGAAAPGDVAVVWLPADGQPFRPRPDLLPRVSEPPPLGAP